MKIKFNKISLSVAAFVAMLAAIPATHAQTDLEQAFVPSPFGEYWKDPFDQCIRTPFRTGDAVPEACGGVSPIAVVQEPVIETMTLAADAFFDFDKSTLKPEGKAKLDELAADLRRVKDVKSIQVVGNTDSIGTEAYNQALSERRAESVASYLVAQGVSPSLIRSRGDGENNPIAPNTIDGRDNPAGRAQNRRVDITVEAMKEAMR